VALLPSPWRLLASGLRRGNTPLVVAGAALVLLRLARHLDGPKRELVYGQTVSAGEAVMIGLLRSWERGGQRRR
jgi:hypothetical protein